MSLQAVVEAEPAAIPELSSLALLSVGCIALAICAADLAFRHPDN
jgi:hypothetical protein